MDKKKLNITGILIINEDFILKLIQNLERKDSQWIQMDKSLPMIYKPAKWLDHECGWFLIY